MDSEKRKLLALCSIVKVARELVNSVGDMI